MEKRTGDENAKKKCLYLEKLAVLWPEPDASQTELTDVPSLPRFTI